MPAKEFKRVHPVCDETCTHDQVTLRALVSLPCAAGEDPCTCDWVRLSESLPEPPTGHVWGYTGILGPLDGGKSHGWRAKPVTS